MADVLLTHSYHLPHETNQLRKMQPVCRNMNVLCLPSEFSPGETESTFPPLEDLIVAVRRS